MLLLYVSMFNASFSVSSFIKYGSCMCLLEFVKVIIFCLLDKLRCISVRDMKYHVLSI